MPPTLHSLIVTYEKNILFNVYDSFFNSLIPMSIATALVLVVQYYFTHPKICDWHGIFMSKPTNI